MDREGGSSLWQRARFYYIVISAVLHLKLSSMHCHWWKRWVVNSRRHYCGLLNIEKLCKRSINNDSCELICVIFRYNFYSPTTHSCFPFLFHLLFFSINFVGFFVLFCVVFFSLVCQFHIVACRWLSIMLISTVQSRELHSKCVWDC